MIYYSYINPIFERDINAHLQKGDEVEVFCYGINGEDPNWVNSCIKIYRLQSRKFKSKATISYLYSILSFWILTFLKITISHQRKHFDLVHVVSPPDFMVLSAIFPKITGSKIVLNIHDIEPEFFMRKFGIEKQNITIRLLLLVEKLCCNFADHILTVTHIWRHKLLIRTGIKDSKCTVFMNVIDDKIIKLAESIVKEDSMEYKLIYHGNLGEHFGVETLIRAMHILRRKVPYIRLAIYGKGPLERYLKCLSRNLKVDDIIDFNGYLPIRKLVEKIKQSDIGIVPTRDGVFAGEALSCKSLEFIALNIPMVISNTQASRYYYDSSMVLYFDSNDPKNLADCVYKLIISDRKKLYLLSNAKKFLKEHNWQIYKKKYFQILNSLCTG
jgi:glycosyltransferase involved in cell wall biosynthesis